MSHASTVHIIQRNSTIDTKIYESISTRALDALVLEGGRRRAYPPQELGQAVARRRAAQREPFRRHARLRLELRLRGRGTRGEVPAAASALAPPPSSRKAPHTAAPPPPHSSPRALRWHRCRRYGPKKHTRLQAWSFEHRAASQARRDGPRLLLHLLLLALLLEVLKVEDAVFRPRRASRPAN